MRATDSNVWTVPVGGGIGKIMKLGFQPINWQLEFYGNAVYPTGGPSWTFRAQIAFLFPKLTPEEKKMLMEEQLKKLEQQQPKAPRRSKLLTNEKCPSQGESVNTGSLRSNQRRGLRLWLILLLAVMTVPSLRAQSDADFDEYKVRVSGFWFYSNPSGTIEDATTGDLINLHKDIGFNSYSTFSGKLDWKFTRKNHVYVAGTPFDQSRQTVLQRTITFQGKTYNVGVLTKVNLSAPLIAPGYQYDISRRKREHIGIAIQIDLFPSNASFFAAAQVNNNNQVVSSKKSLLAPIPVAGPQFRFYLTDSPRLFVEGNLFGMYLFGYGNFISTADDIGVTLTKHLSLNAGYQLGTRLNVNVDEKKDRFGLSLTQKGPIVGAQVSF